MKDLITKQFGKWAAKQSIQASELKTALKAFAKILTGLSANQIEIALQNGDFKELTS